MPFSLKFARHLISDHTFDVNGSAQWKIQRDLVQRMENQVMFQSVAPGLYYHIEVMSQRISLCWRISDQDKNKVLKVGLSVWLLWLYRCYCWVKALVLWLIWMYVCDLRSQLVLEKKKLQAIECHLNLSDQRSTTSVSILISLSNVHHNNRLTYRHVICGYHVVLSKCCCAHSCRWASMNQYLHYSFKNVKHFSIADRIKF